MDRMGLALLVGATAWLSLALTRAPGSVAAVWIGNGIFVGWLLSRPTRLWGGYLVAGFLGELVIRQWSGTFMLPRLGISAANLIEVAIVAGTVRRLVPDIGDPKGWLRLGWIATGSTLIACALSGLLGAVVVTDTFGTSFLGNFLTWYTAHVVGMVIVATFTLVVHREGLSLVDVGGRWDFLGCMLVLAAVAAVVFFQSRYPLLFLTYPPLLWGAFRHRFAGAVVGVSLLVLIGGIATALGHGPLVMVQVDDIGPTQRTLLLQLFIGTACLVTTRDPDEGWVNFGAYRGMVHDEKSMGLYISPGKHGSIQRNKYFERGKPCPVIVSVGQDPVLFMVSGNEIDYGVSEFDYAGGLKGAPVEVIEGQALDGCGERVQEAAASASV